MLTARPWNKIVDPSLDSLGLEDSEDERLKLKQYAAYYAVGMSYVVGRMPPAWHPRVYYGKRVGVDQGRGGGDARGGGDEGQPRITIDICGMSAPLVHERVA